MESQPQNPDLRNNPESLYHKYLTLMYCSIFFCSKQLCLVGWNHFNKLCIKKKKKFSKLVKIQKDH